MFDAFTPMVDSPKNILSSIVCLIVFSFAGLGQTLEQVVSGTVRDASGSAVSSATVHLLNGRHVPVGTAQSDEQGRFVIESVPQGTYELLVTAAGFAARRAAVQVPSSGNRALDIRLGVESLMSEITVTADLGTVQELAGTTQRVNVIDEEELQQRASTVVAQAFREEPGLQLQRTSSTISGVFVRGLTGAKVVVFVDGVRFSTFAMRGGINTFFNTNDVSGLRAAEVLRGPNSAQFGSDSLGGSVQLISRPPLFTHSGWETHGRLSTHYNSADQGFGGSSLITFAGPKLTALVNISSHRSNTLRSGQGLDSHAAVTRFLAIRSDVFGERSTDTAFTQYGGQFKLTYKPTSADFLNAHYSRTQIDGGKRFDQTLGGDGNLIADLRNFMNDFFYGRYERFGSWGFDTVSVTGSYNTQREERINQGGNGNPLATISFQPERTAVRGFQTQATRTMGRNSVAFGGEFYYDRLRTHSYSLDPLTQIASVARGRVPDGTTYKSGGIFGQDAFTAIPDRLKLIAAVRWGRSAYSSRAANSPLVGGLPLWPDDSLTATAVTPRFGAVITVNDDLSLTAQVSRGFRAPSITDLGTLGLTGAGFEANATDLAGMGATVGSTADATATSLGIPVEQLKPELLWSYEAGARYRRSRVDIEFSSFINELKNNIAYQSLILPTGAVGKRLGDQTISSQTTNGAVFVPLSTAPVLVRANFDHARIWGIEQKVDVRIADSLTAGQNFTYLHAEDKRTHLPPNIEGGTPAPQGYAHLRYEPAGQRFWIQPLVFGAFKQDRLSSLDLGDRRTGATRTRGAIANFFGRGAAARGLIAPGSDGRLGTADDLLAPTGETLAQVQNRVLGTAASAPLYSYIPGFLVLSVRAGFRFAESHEVIVDFENITDKSYRGISWGMDAPGRSFGFRHNYRF
jgi:hemoglobin/transferrin/lactoferrin receptor protein